MKNNRYFVVFFLVVVLGIVLSCYISYEMADSMITRSLESNTTSKESTGEIVETTKNSEGGQDSTSFKKKEEAFANMTETEPTTNTKCPKDGAVCVATASSENGKLSWDIYRYTSMGNLHVYIVDNKGCCIEFRAVFDRIDDDGIILRNDFETICLNGVSGETGGFDVDIFHADYY